MTQPAPRPLADPAALARQRARASALFLQEDVAAEIEERLSEVNRTFTAPAVVTPFPPIWRRILPRARIVADTDVLALDPGAHDLVIHALALHWAADPVGQLIQCRRALRPDGLFLGALFGGETLAELRAALAQAEAEVSGGLSPRILPMAEIRDLGGLLQRAGFALPVADTSRRTVSYADAMALMRDLRAMGEGNALAARHRRIPPRALFARAADLYAAAAGIADGRVRATFDIIHLSGWAPDESQQKPLRPGSARTSLAAALDSLRPNGSDPVP